MPKINKSPTQRQGFFIIFCGSVPDIYLLCSRIILFIRHISSTLPLFLPVRKYNLRNENHSQRISIYPPLPPEHPSEPAARRPRIPDCAAALHAVFCEKFHCGSYLFLSFEKLSFPPMFSVVFLVLSNLLHLLLFPYIHHLIKKALYNKNRI